MSPVRTCECCGKATGRLLKAHAVGRYEVSTWSAEREDHDVEVVDRERLKVILAEERFPEDMWDLLMDELDRQALGEMRS